MNGGLIDEVLALKREKNAIVLAHNYVDLDVQRVADFTGDSYDLALKAMDAGAEVVVFAGVKFMAEQAKALNYDKVVLAPDPYAGCTIADALSVDVLKKVKEEYPRAPVVLYINTNADVKALADYIVTSSTAVKLVKRLNGETIIFGPDRNLAEYVERMTGKRIIKVPPSGFCVVHNSFTEEMIKEARGLYPRAKILIHPEAPFNVIKLADFVGSTNQMIEYAAREPSSEFIVGTEIGMLNTLKAKVPNKSFYPLTREPYSRCPFMAAITLEKVRRSLRDLVHRVELPKSTAEAIKEAFERTRKILES